MSDQNPLRGARRRRRRAARVVEPGRAAEAIAGPVPRPEPSRSSAGEGDAHRLDGQAAARRGAGRPARRARPGSGWPRSTSARVEELARRCRPTCRTSCATWRCRSRTARCPSEAELRVAQAQLVGWLEGLFHGIQATLFAQQMAARQQLEQMRGQLLPGQPAPRPGGRAGPSGHVPLSDRGPGRRDWPVGDSARGTLAKHTVVSRRHAVEQPAGRRRRSRPRAEGGGRRGRLVHPPPRPHRVLDARRRGAARRAGGGGGGRRPAGARHHRPRQHVRGPRLLQGVPGPGREAGHRHRGLHGPRPPVASVRRAGAASTTPAATPRAARSSTTTSRCWPRPTRATAT